MNIKRIIIALSVPLSLASADANAAATYQFELTGAYTAKWHLLAAPVPSDSFDAELFTVWDVAGDFPESSGPTADLTFFSAAHGGGLGIYDFHGTTNLLSTDGPQLYSGSEASPIFALGTFTLTQYHGAERYTLVVSEVPELGTQPLLFCGLLAAAAVRRRG